MDLKSPPLISCYFLANCGGFQMTPPLKSLPQIKPQFKCNRNRLDFDSNPSLHNNFPWLVEKWCGPLWIWRMVVCLVDGHLQYGSLESCVLSQKLLGVVHQQNVIIDSRLCEQGKV